MADAIADANCDRSMGGGKPREFSWTRLPCLYVKLYVLHVLQQANVQDVQDAGSESRI